MKFPIVTAIVLTFAATAGVPAHATRRIQSRTLRVETPASNPELAVPNAQALYLHMTGDGRTLLYVEEQNGCGLAVLDVTTPSNIRRVADAAITATSAFDFVKPIGDNAVLVRYRDGSGYALLDLTHSQHPVLAASAALAQSAAIQHLGETGLLASVAANTSESAGDPQTYRVLDISAPTAPHVLATVANVTQQVSNGETGTLFLLNQHGITVVRRLPVEQEHEAELVSEEHN